MTMRSMRCAMYTRKSSEEGLDQAFNSLDAQREACHDYIKSQKHQGWTALADSFDDGGYSGGHVDRPGLQRLLAAIDAGRVDIVVVYKVDRLSRSLSDFARLMQLFDARGVSFVSVTQQFNTTTSMGRLTLNMLLSFAQFEREVTGERIRDKIAATKKKGVWVCGQPPIGYRLSGESGDLVLRVNPDEAEVVRGIYRAYLEAGSLLEVARRMNSLGYTTKKWRSSKERSHGGRPFTSALVYRILTNPIYIGKITHTRRLTGSGGHPSHAEIHTEVYEGQHEPIIDRAIWDQVQADMKRMERAASGENGWTHTHLLKGKLKTAEGRSMSPSHVTKRRGGTRGEDRHRVPYYVSQKAIKEGFRSCSLKSINALHIDELVRTLVLDHLASSMGHQMPVEEPSKRDRMVRDLIERVVLAPDRLMIELITERIASTIECLQAAKPRGPSRDGKGTRAVSAFRPSLSERGAFTVLSLAIQIKKLDGKRMLVGPDGQDLLAAHGIEQPRVPNPTLINALALAHAWHRELLRTGETIDALAERVDEYPQRIHHLLPLTQLGPVVTRAILTGTLSPNTSLKRLLTVARRLDWDAQASMLGLHANSSKP